MDCEEIEELAGAYTLWALPSEEAAAVSAHLDSCGRHPEMLELRSIAASLAQAAPGVQPPATLKSRLMAAIEAEGAVRQRGTVAPMATRRILGEAIRGWLTNPRIGYVLSSALTVALVGLLAWNIALQNGSSNQVVINLSGAASGRLIYIEDEQLAVFDVHDLALLPADKVYQVWSMAPDAATAIGVLTPTAAGDASAAMSLNATGVARLGVTIEEGPGSDRPTTSPVIVANFP